MPSLTNFPNGVSSFGMPVLPGVSMPFTGNVYFVDPVNGGDGNDGKAPGAGRAFKTLYRAHGECTSGNNDVVFLVGNGAISGTAQLTLAGAVAETSRTGATAATAGTLVWSKNATHLIGISSGNGVASRARIGSSYGVTGDAYTVTTFGSKTFVSVTAYGCMFNNIFVTNDFSTGGTAELLWVDTGQRNNYVNCHFFGMANAASAADADSRTLVVGSGGNGENTFYNCVIGGDTVSRSAANASLELTGGTPRNRFIDCMFPFYATNAGVLGVLCTGAAAIDRWTLFKGCSFINAIQSAATTMTVLMSMTSASSGGLFLIQDCLSIGMTDLGGTNALAHSYVQPALSNSTTGLAVVCT